MVTRTVTAGVYVGRMQQSTSVVLLDRAGPVARHDHLVRRFSRDLDLLRTLDRVLVRDPELTREFVSSVCSDFAVPKPELLLRSNRKPETGMCDAPRRRLVARFGEERVAEAERRGAVVTHLDGRIRLGTETLAGTIAHELGHHLVNHTSGSRTPGHGKAWVAAYDAAARRLAIHPGLRDVLASWERPLPTLAP